MSFLGRLLNPMRRVERNNWIVTDRIDIPRWGDLDALKIGILDLAPDHGVCITVNQPCLIGCFRTQELDDWWYSRRTARWSVVAGRRGEYNLGDAGGRLNDGVPEFVVSNAHNIKPTIMDVMTDDDRKEIDLQAKIIADAKKSGNAVKELKATLEIYYVQVTTYVQPTSVRRSSTASRRESTVSTDPCQYGVGSNGVGTAAVGSAAVGSAAIGMGKGGPGFPV